MANPKRAKKAGDVAGDGKAQSTPLGEWVTWLFVEPFIFSLFDSVLGSYVDFSAGQKKTILFLYWLIANESFLFNFQG